MIDRFRNLIVDLLPSGTAAPSAAANRPLVGIVFAIVLTLGVSTYSTPALAQFGGGGMGGGGAGGPGGASAPGAEIKPKFRDHIHSQDGMNLHREKGDTMVLSVQITGNRNISSHEIIQQLQTRKGRFYDYETVLGDVRRLNDMGSFDHVTFKTKEYPEQNGVSVAFLVHERAIIKQVIFHGNRALNDRELKGRAGLNVNDPLSEFAIESARRRMLDYYREEGFNQASLSVVTGARSKPGVVEFRINEGPLERIWSITIEGNTILTSARLKKLIKSRGPAVGVIPYLNNKADLRKIDKDVDILAATYHNLGYLTATVGRRISYDDDGKWMYVTFVINEGPRFKINNIQIEGNQFVTVKSVRDKLTLKAGDMFDGTLLRRDVGEIVYGYGELGFIYAEVKPQTVMRDDSNTVDLIYKIEEGDRWRINQIRVNIEGEPHLMRETTMLNMLELREGDFIDRRLLEIARRRITSSQLLEVNPQIADPPDIIVQPNDER
ncbi:BamA/OMP85 family outer membrane protein [Planctomycetes bacterium K23_9]|uniref:Outer membrane protein assembly factor BamA n=1 Tax=Stieleria marina TaxID=1930275 RepID=A0A517NQN0_9BACT|nr:Outer membrane protein assembly factor BamA precursor [Planctomycetes bacterium K23_9]